MSDVIETEIEAAEQLLKDDRLAEAQGIFEETLAAQPENIRAIIGLGVIALKRNELDQAIDLFGVATSADPKNAPAFANLSLAYQAKEDFEAAEDCIRHALSLSPNEASFLVALGFLTLKDGQQDESEKCFAQAMRLDATNIDARFGMGCLLMEKHASEEAEELFKSCLKDKPDAMAPRNALAALHVAQSKFAEAEQGFRQVLKQNPTDEHAVMNLAHVLINLQKADQAEPLLKRILRLQPKNPNMLHMMGQALLAQGKASEAITYLSEALKLAPDAQIVAANLITALRHIGDLAKAERLAAHMCEARPDETGFRMLAMDCYFASGAWHKAWSLQTQTEDLADGVWVLNHLDRDMVFLLRLANSQNEAWKPKKVMVPDGEYDIMRKLLPSDVDVVGTTEPPAGSGKSQASSMLGQLAPNIDDLMTYPVQPPSLAEQIEFPSILKGRDGPIYAVVPGPDNSPHWVAAGQPGPEELITTLGKSQASFLFLAPWAQAQLPTNIISDTSMLTSLESIVSLFAHVDGILACDHAIGHLGGLLGTKTALMLPSFCDGRWGVQATTPIYPSARLFHKSNQGQWTDVISHAEKWLNS